MCIRDRYGLAGSPAYAVTVKTGKLLSTQFELTIQAENFATQFQLSRADLPNDLPVMVKNLNDHWDAAMFDLETGVLRRVGVGDDVGYVTVDTSKPRKLWIGNLVRVDNLAIRASVVGHDDHYVIDLNNPLHADTWATVETPDELASLYQFKERYRLRAGERRTIAVPKRKIEPDRR